MGKKRKPKLSIYLVMFILCIGLVSAFETYSSTGTTDNDFTVGRNNFNSAITGAQITGQVGTSDAKLGVLVEDLNADNVTEVIILDSGDIKILEGKTLIPITSFSVGAGLDTYSNIEIFDIDGDSEIEIIVHNQDTNKLHILEYNGSILTDERNNNHNITGSYLEGDTIIKCSATSQCIIISSRSVNSANGGGTSAVLEAWFFDDNSISSSKTIIDQDVTTSNQYCAPKIKEIALAEVDSTNSGLEYVTAWKLFKPTGGAEEIIISRLDFSDPPVASTSIFNDFEGSSISHFSGYSSTQCDSVYTSGVMEGRSLGETYTSPAIIETDGFGPQAEIVVASLVGSDEYRAGLYSMPSGVVTEVEDGSMPRNNFFNTNTNADGESLSNVFAATVFLVDGESPGNSFDYCVMGFHETDQELNMMCGSPVRLEGYSEEYVFNYNTDFWNHSNDNSDMQAYSNMVHASRVSLGTEGLTNGFTTGFGIFTLQSEESDLVLAFSNSLLKTEPTSCIMVDLEKIGAEDLICVNDNIIFYQDDNVLNGVATLIEPLSFTPCYSEPIKVNTTIEIMVTAQDNNPSSFGFEDNVNINVTVYDGTSFPQTMSTPSSINSGTTWPFSFVLNHTSSSFIKIQAWDDANPSEIALLTFPLTVATSGLETGDSSCDFSFVAEDTGLGGVNGTGILADGTNLEENAFTSISEEVGLRLGIGTTTFWMLILLIVYGAIFWQGAAAGKPYLGFIGANITAVLGIFVLARLGIVGTGTIITITIVGLVLLIPWIRSLASGSSEGSS